MKRWLLFLGFAVGCGPVAYINQVTRSADSAVDEARAAQADKYAPYWWTRAVQYLHMAREVAGHADFQGANHFGRLAAEAAVRAKTDAKIAEKDPSKRPLEHDAPDGVAPAKGKGDVAPAKDDR